MKHSKSNSSNNPDLKNINNSRETSSPTLKLLLEMGPLVVFFLANYKGQWLINNIGLFKSFNKPIFPATAVFMIAIIIALSLSWFIMRKIPIVPLISGIFVLVFGFLTLWLHNDTFIKMKPTIINSLFALILFGGLLFKKPLLRYVFDSNLKMNDTGWQKLTYRWAFFFVFLAVLNEVIWRNFSDNFWASFKVFGVMSITLIFMLSQITIIMKYSTTPLIKKDKSNSQAE
ncbi:septation protein A [Bartonella schoenbuchensis]|uniref:Inner membrane-spanning protein YciB n=1 Tax=Bartonella schoenbuchensis m07a TaxID=1094496 RepID=N6UKL4_9HYPH|nr:septation protein A [Bartonella schoenbuchensis]ENN90758.1 intracellular septation protein A [Bartonella schoenbuchensis m07a]